MVVVPSSAVTKVVIVFEPTASASAPDAVPEVTGEPSTVIVAVMSAAVGVTVIEVTPFATLAV